MLQFTCVLILLFSSPQQPGEKPSAPPRPAKEKATEITGTTTTHITIPEDKEEPEEKPTPAPRKARTPRRAVARAPKTKVEVVHVKADEVPSQQMLKLGLELFVNYGFVKSDNDNTDGNRWTIDRSHINFGFNPTKIASAHITLDTMRQVGAGKYDIYLKYGWLQFTNISEVLTGISLNAGQVENGWKRYREKMTGSRYFQRTLLDMYSLLPEGDLGVWAEGTVLNDMFTFWAGAGNGAGVLGSEQDKGKVIDLHGAYHLKVPVPMSLGVYFRTQVNDNYTNTGENTLSITTAGSFDFSYEMFKVGIEGFFHTYNDWAPNALNELVDIRRTFYGGSVHLSATPKKKIYAFVRADMLWYRHGNAETDPSRYNSQNFYVGAGYNLFPNFWIGGTLSVRKVNGMAGTPAPTGSMSSGYYAPSESAYWYSVTDGETTFTINTRFVF